MTLFRSVVGGIVVMTVATVFSADNPKTDRDRIQGSWKGLKLEVQGKAAPAEYIEKAKYVFKETKLTIFEGVKNVVESEFTLDPDKNPKTIDLVATEGPGKGRKMFGIYRIEDDSLTLCIGEKRPTEFSGAGPAGLVQFKRSKDVEKKPE